jgi:Leucine-rich repeat (LRR) protein
VPAPSELTGGCVALAAGRRLDLSENALESLDGIAHNIELTWLKVSGNRLSTLGDGALRRLGRLKVLNASNNRLAGELHGLGGLAELQVHSAHSTYSPPLDVALPRACTCPLHRGGHASAGRGGGVVEVWVEGAGQTAPLRTSTSDPAWGTGLLQALVLSGNQLTAADGLKSLAKCVCLWF